MWRPRVWRLNCNFRDPSRLVHTQWQDSTDPYGKPAILFKHEGGAEAIAGELRKMLSADFAKNLNVELYNSNSQTRKAAIKEPVQTEAPLLSLYEAFEKPKQQATITPKRRTKTVKESPTPQRSLFDFANEEEAKQEAVQTPSMEPRPYSGELLPHFREGSFVLDNEQIGYLSKCNRLEATFKPIELNK